MKMMCIAVTESIHGTEDGKSVIKRKASYQAIGSEDMLFLVNSNDAEVGDVCDVSLTKLAPQKPKGPPHV